MATFTAPAPAPAALFGRPADFFTLGGLSLLLFAAVLLLRLDPPPAALAAPLLIAAMAVNWPHYAATYVRAYRSPEAVRAHLAYTVVVPLVLAAAALAALLDPERLAPLFFKAYLLSAGYHYSGQSYGVALIFLNKARLAPTRAMKWLLAAPLYLAWGYYLVHREVADAAPETVSESFALAPLGLPAALVGLAPALLVSSVGLYAAFVAWTYLRSGRGVPAAAHVAVGAHLVWFGLWAHHTGLTQLVPFFHCLQYLAVTTYFRTRTRPAGPAAGDLRRYYTTLVALGLGLFVALPAAVARLGLADAVRSEAVVVAWINLHHFLLDGAIWKLRKAENREALVAR